jgi:hypothetical protein
MVFVVSLGRELGARPLSREPLTAYWGQTRNAPGDGLAMRSGIQG